MLTRKIRRLLSLLAAAPLLVAGCTDNDLTGPYGEVSGTYQLTVFAGRSVPATITCNPGECGLSNGGTFQATDGTLVLNRNGTYTETNHYVTTPTGGFASNSTFVSTGTFTVNGDAFTLSDGQSQRFVSGTITFNTNNWTINYTEDNESYEYQR